MTRESWYKISLGLNAVLVAMVVLLATRPHATSSRPRSDDLSKGPRAPQVGRRTDSSQAAPKFSGQPSNWEPWIESLRASGAPDHVIVQVVLADFNERWRRRFDELQNKIERGEAPESALASLGRDRDFAQEQELRRALGEERFKRWDRANTLQSLNLGQIALTGAEADAIYGLQKNLQQQFRDLEEAKDVGEMDQTELVAWQKKIQTEFDQRLKTLLGDERLAAMQGSNEAGDGELRRSLRNVNANDAQFDALLKAQREWMARRDELERQPRSDAAGIASYDDQLKALDAARDQEFQRVLGPGGYDAFQKEQDPNYNKMKLYANVWGLNADSIDYVYRSLKYYEKSSADYQQQTRAREQKGEVVDWNVVNQNLRQFSKQAEDALRNYLGQDRYNKLKQNAVLPFQSDPEP